MVCRKVSALPHTAVQGPVPYFPAIHLAPQSPFYGPPGHIRSRDGTDLCPSSAANPSRQHSRAYPLARCFARSSPTCLARPSEPGPILSCNSPCTPIAFLPASRAHPLARWHRFVSIGNREPLQTSLQGISARAMFCRKVSELPRTAVQGLCPLFLQITWHGNRHSRGLQGTSTRAMAPICVHRAPQTPPDIAPRHIRSRDDLQEEPRPATHSPVSPSMTFRVIHLEPGSPFYAGTRHTPGPGDIKLCSPAPFPLANYLIINNGRFQVNFMKPQKKNTPDLN